MKILNPKIKLDEFWNSLKRSSQSVLMLDYDGTLAPFTTKRNNAVPYEGVRQKLELLICSARTLIVIVSGRDIKTIKQLLNLENIPDLYGCHGAEHYHPDTGYELSINKRSKELLTRTKFWILEKKLEKYIEYKPVSIAFHWRGLSKTNTENLKVKVENYWQSIVSRYNLELHYFDGGIEIRPIDTNKGLAVKKIISKIDKNSPIAYLGDDLTDEDAFKALPDSGIKVLVNKKLRTTSADIQLIPPEELLYFLDKWIESTSFK